MRTITIFKRITLFVSLFFLTVAIVSAFLFLYFFKDGSIEHTVHELFYWLSIASATICLCLLPIMSYFNGEQHKKESESNNEQIATQHALNDFACLAHSNDYRFVTKVIVCFYRDLDVADKIKNFHQFPNNDVYYDCLKTAINASLSLKTQKNNPNSTTEWVDYLVASVEKCWHLYTLDTNLEKIDSYKKLDAFIISLMNVSNKLEVISYSFMELRISKKAFIKELYEPLNSFYSNAYFFLRELNNCTSFPALDSTCRMIYTEIEEGKEEDDE